MRSCNIPKWYPITGFSPYSLSRSLVLGVPIGLGALQKILDRVTLAIQPHDEALAHVARHAPVNDIDETPWLCHGTLPGLWVMASPQAACYRIDPSRSKEAFLALIAD